MSRAIRAGLLVVLLISAGCGRGKSEEGAPKSDPAMGIALIDEYIVRDSRGERLRANPVRREGRLARGACVGRANRCRFVFDSARTFGQSVRQLQGHPEHCRLHLCDRLPLHLLS